MDDEQAWLRFANLQLPARLANAVLSELGSPQEAFAATPAQLDALPSLSGKQALRVADPTFVPTDAQLTYLREARVHILPITSTDYPPSLKQIPDPPPVLFVRGEIVEKDRFAVGVVGSRHATPYGRSVAARMASDLSRAGLTVVSGGAIGIDSAAHRAVVESGGRTIVVLGCGLDIDYPRENHSLFECIAAGGRGALITEFPLGATPEPWRFPMRNRVISGLSMGVVVVEAGAQSGALVTAGVAAEQGRDVMAVPGNVDRIGSKGTNALIRDGAALVEDARDVIAVLGILALESPESAAQTRASVPKHLPESQRRILACLSLTAKHIDGIAAEVGMPGPEASVELTLLELAGLARRLPGNCYIRAL